MKRLICLLAVFCLVLPMAVVPAAAAGVSSEARVTEHEPCVYLEDGISPHVVQTFDFDVPGDDQYYLLASNVDLRAGQNISVSGTWSPFYSTLWVRLEKVGGVQSDRAISLTEGKTATLDVKYDGTYRLWVAASTYASKGTLSVTW